MNLHPALLLAFVLDAIALIGACVLCYLGILPAGALVPVLCAVVGAGAYVRTRNRPPGDGPPLSGVLALAILAFPLLALPFRRS